MSSFSSSSPTLNYALTTGDIVSNGFRLYRSNFQSYFVIALVATLWLLLPFVGIIVWSVGISMAYTVISSQSTGLFVLGFIALLIGLIFISIRSVIRACLNMALIARLAYGDFTNKPETVAAARQALRPRGKGILFSFILSFLLLFSINIGLSIANAPLTFLFSILFRGLEAEWIAFLLSNLITFCIFTWISAGFFLVEVPIVLEDHLTAIQSIRRSWNLAKGSVLRILLVITIAFLVTIPLYSLASVPPILGLVAATPALDRRESQYEIAFLTRFLPGLAIGGLLFLAMNMMVMGFWQSIKAVMYYDLRSRREGVDIELSHRQPSVTSGDAAVASARSTMMTQRSEPPLAISEAAKSIASQLLEQADCSQLSEGNWWQLRNYLENRKTLDPAIKAEQSLLLARHCRDEICLQKLPKQMTADLFLEALYWAIVTSNVQPK